MIRLRAVALSFALLTLASPGFAAPSAVRAVGGVRLMEAMENAPAAAVVQVKTTRELPDGAFAAVMRVESPVVGDAAIGTLLNVAWEERSRSRAPRFATGERVLVVLESLSGASIWLSRLPDPKERSTTLGVAMRGDAFLRNPSLGTANLLEHYLALAAADRAGANGVGYLAQLVAAAEVPLAIDVVARLDTRGELDAKLGPGGALQLTAALVRDDGTEALQDSLVALIGRHRLVSMQVPLEALAANAERLPPPVVYTALARLEGGFSPERTAQLLAQGGERYRQVGARHAGGDKAPHELRSLARRDPSSKVRISALERLVELRGDGAIETLGDALADSEPTVRAAAAIQLGALGSAAVPDLVRITEAGETEAARAAIVALALTGSAEGSAALQEIAEWHSDESLRGLAKISLGQEIGDTHD
ncbi:MAG: HEAT repeat domain-containing protein [Deltaproteobacteria bacterium]|nr:HEAT repeat domain-containing protein [Deltaproteobacteria bacterium]MBW2667665.1 HEAT repeat domain-containing protein [Deltaproteobacteria bacterium]